MRSLRLGAALRAARTRAGLSQKALAARLGYERSSIAHVERGDQRPPEEFWSRADVVCRAEGQLLAAYRQHLSSRAERRRPPFDTFAVPAAEEDETDRRDLLKCLRTAGIVVAGWPLAPSALAETRRVTLDEVEHVRRAAQLYRAAIYQHGATVELQRGLTALLDRTTALLSEVNGPGQRSELLDVLADTAGVAGYASRDRGQVERAHHFYVLGLQASRSAEDPVLARYLLVRLAGLYLELTQPREVLTCLDSAERVGTPTHAEKSNLLMLRAWALAQSGEAQEVHRAVGRAEEEMSRVGDQRDDVVERERRHVSPAELFSLTGASYVELARREPRHAREAARRLVMALGSRGPEYARNATLDVVSLAEAHLRGGDLDAARHFAHRAETAARTTTSRRVHRRLGELRQGLRLRQA
ncbi:helix-turn-helix domain-containing protein [Streptoalloteichus hindustanus]|uniref:Helix-turn-helix domain-containing protein n=1 Tax=Streptoalloteichus hindustanus TaxID=2017 RepID=A0A1M5DE44_STRHI|nr:helix-turn-helix transcriptional regulator [Streptoalloteichus hindustanus]SHF65348.1 Helix-turn-helix domain-containing protein [Streptoalloteichus hindustanus]